MSLNIFFAYSETHARSIQVSGFSDRTGLRLHLAFAVDIPHGLMGPGDPRFQQDEHSQALA